MKVRLLNCFLALCIFVLATHPQNTTKADKPVMPVIVKANVLVLDSSDKSIEDVKLADIKIFEDGVEQKVEALEKKGPDLTVVVAVDNSNSVRSQIERLIDSAKAIASEVRPNDQVLALRFVNSEKINVIQEFTNDKQKLLDAFESMYTEGGMSAVTDGVYRSVGLLMEREKLDHTRRYAVIVLSDFDDRNSFYRRTSLFELISKSDTQIYPLKFPGVGLTEKASAALDKLALDLALNSGGTAHILGLKSALGVPKSVQANLDVMLRKIMAELRSPYVVRYRSTNQNRDGLTRTLRVEVADGPNGEKRRGITRTEFIVPKD